MSEFIWDEILIMEYARLVSKEYRNAESWTWDYTSEEEIMKRFKISKQPKPEWEILKGCSQNGRPHDWESDGDRSCPNMGCKIYSVKRLGDGEVFTVGDEAHSPGDRRHPGDRQEPVALCPGEAQTGAGGGKVGSCLITTPPPIRWTRPTPRPKPC